MSHAPRSRLLVVALLATVAPVALRAQEARTNDSRSLRVAAAPVGSPAVTVVLQPSDVVRIQVWRKPELSGEFTVGADGALRHPVYHDVAVAGMPMPEVESRIRSILMRFEAAPVFIVEPLLRVSVEGEVRQPGLYAMSVETTLGQAIGVAGGATSAARTDRVTLRRGSSVVSLDLNDPRTAASATRVQSGDRIIVAQQRSILRDYIAPIASIAAAVGTAVTIATRSR